MFHVVLFLVGSECDDEGTYIHVKLLGPYSEEV